MNSIRATTYLVYRTYSSKPLKKFVKPTKVSNRAKAASKNAHNQRKVQDFVEDEDDIDSLEDFDNLESYESDFMNVHKSYNEHQRELYVAKEKLKVQIIARKYYNEKQPNMLTFAEKEQIRLLHESDPVEWPVERLSDSFPAQPEVIKKILKAKWRPDSVEKVLKYDQGVVENWEKFKRGELPLDDRLRLHLMKFKNRHVVTTDREQIAEKIVAPKCNFPAPKSMLFSNIVSHCENGAGDKIERWKRHTLRIGDRRGATESENKIDSVKFESNNDESAEETRSIVFSKANNELTFDPKLLKTKSDGSARGKPMRKAITFDEFIKSKVKGIKGKPSAQELVYLEAYKKHMEAEIRTRDEEEYAIDAAKKSEIEEESRVTADLMQPSRENAEISKVENEASQLEEPVEVAERKELDTYVKEWIKKTDENEDYPNYIKIPKNKFKIGKTYRVKDRYYDYDGEFLYRVPGLKL